jgi:cobalt/nickel transport system permease protein
VSGHHDLRRSGALGDARSPVHRLDPRAKLIGLLGVTVVAVSTPLEAWPAYVACLAVLVVVWAAARVPVGAVLGRAAIVLPVVLVAAALLPLVREGGAEVAATVAIKALIGTFAAVLLGATTAFGDLLRGLQGLRVPNVLVLTAAFMYRYLGTIAGELRRMRIAQRARAYRPRRLWHAGALGRLGGALFVRSYSRGERVHLAMLARGFDGRISGLRPLVLRRADVLFVAAIAAGLLTARVAA